MCTVVRQRAMMRLAAGKITEVWCLTEEKALNMTPFLPLGTDLPREIFYDRTSERNGVVGTTGDELCDPAGPSR